MKTKTFTILANWRVLLVPRNAEKNLKTIAKTIASAANYADFSSESVLLSSQLLYEKRHRARQ